MSEPGAEQGERTISLFELSTDGCMDGFLVCKCQAL